MSFRSFVLASAIACAAATPTAARQHTGSHREPDVIFVPTPPAVVDAMLKLARVTSSDVVYDLGSGDGRILIAAAKMYGARGVGIDIDPKLVSEATANALTNGVAEKVTFLNEDLFTADISPATVVTVYLSSPLNLKLADKLMKDLKPGTRIVSHAYDMGDWKPQQKQTVSGRAIYLWTIPPTPRR
jgi:SAM-dependent methyltransferase